MELQSPVLAGLPREEDIKLSDWNLPAAFLKKRHTEKIEGCESLAKSWRMKDRVRDTLETPPEGGGNIGAGWSCARNWV